MVLLLDEDPFLLDEDSFLLDEDPLQKQYLDAKIWSLFNFYFLSSPCWVVHFVCISDVLHDWGLLDEAVRHCGRLGSGVLSLVPEVTDVRPLVLCPIRTKGGTLSLKWRCLGR